MAWRGGTGEVLEGVVVGWKFFSLWVYEHMEACCGIHVRILGIDGALQWCSGVLLSVFCQTWFYVQTALVQGRRNAIISN